MRICILIIKWQQLCALSHLAKTSIMVDFLFVFTSFSHTKIDALTIKYWYLFSHKDKYSTNKICIIYISMRNMKHPWFFSNDVTLRYLFNSADVFFYKSLTKQEESGVYASSSSKSEIYSIRRLKIWCIIFFWCHITFLFILFNLYVFSIVLWYSNPIFSALFMFMLFYSVFSNLSTCSTIVYSHLSYPLV